MSLTETDLGEIKELVKLRRAHLVGHWTARERALENKWAPVAVVESLLAHIDSLRPLSKHERRELLLLRRIATAVRQVRSRGTGHSDLSEALVELENL